MVTFEQILLVVGLSIVSFVAAFLVAGGGRNIGHMFRPKRTPYERRLARLNRRIARRDGRQK